MANITNYLNKIKTAVYGKDVRGAIHDAIKQVYDDASVNHDNANMEVKMARGTHNTLNDRLDNVDEIQAQTNAQLSDISINVRNFGAIGDGIADDTKAIQSAINYAKANGNNKVILSGTYKISSLVVESGVEIDFNNSLVEPICSNGVLFEINLPTKISNLRIKNSISNLTLFSVKSSNKDDEIREVSVLKNIDVENTDGSLSDSTFIKIDSDTYGKGIYRLTVSEVQVDGGGIFAHLKCSAEKAWINSNVFEKCYIRRCKTAIKMERANDVMTEIRDNRFNINFQNDINYITNAKVFDIEESSYVAYNKITGFLWDLDANLTHGSIFSPVGYNSFENYESVKFVSNTYQLLGCISRKTGQSFVEFNITNYHNINSIYRIYCETGGTAIGSQIIHNDSVPDIDFYRLTKNGITYIYAKTSASFVDIKISSSNGFTPSPYLTNLTSLESGEKINFSRVNYSVYKNSNNELRDIKYLMSNSSKMRSDVINSLDELLTGEVLSGIRHIAFNAKNIAELNDGIHHGFFLDFGTGVSSTPHYGSSVFIFSGRTGDMFVSHYTGSWSEFKKIGTIG